MEKKVKILIWVVALIAVFILIPWLTIQSTYNDLVAKEEAINDAWAQVQTVLQRRYDLIPNLVETVKGYAIHEREVLTQVTEARAKVGRARTPQEQIQANNELSGALARLLVVVERYPELRANQNFIRLQDELAGTENRIAVARRRYNEAVMAYHRKMRSFPTVLFAGMLGFEKKAYFEAPEAAQEAPRVDFRGGEEGRK